MVITSGGSIANGLSKVKASVSRVAAVKYSVTGGVLSLLQAEPGATIQLI